MREGVFVCLLLIEYGLSSVWFLILQFVMCNVAQAKVVLGMGFLYSSRRFLKRAKFDEKFDFGHVQESRACPGPVQKDKSLSASWFFVFRHYTFPF